MTAEVPEPIFPKDVKIEDEFGFNVNGTWYREVLEWFHTFLKPKNYFEIGTQTGSTLELAQAKAIAVDPHFAGPTAPAGPRPVTMYFQMESDDFFAEYDPKYVFGAPVEFAFLDGLHEAETLLRDFYNTEKSCKRNSIICLHDCVPSNESMLSRANNKSTWTGDVWKILPILKKYRRDLDIHVFNAAPTGLVVCTNLDPASTVLEDNYSNIWKNWSAIDLKTYGYQKFLEDCDLRPTSTIDSAEEMRRYFWL